MRNKINKLIGLTILILMLTGCASNPPGLGLDIRSARSLNPDVNGEASPVVVSIYQLKSRFRFDNADYNALANKSRSVLGSDLLDTQTIEIRPNQNKQINFDVSQNTTYIGIAAAYRDINTAQWRTTIQLSKRERAANVIVNLGSQKVSAYLMKKK